MDIEVESGVDYFLGCFPKRRRKSVNEGWSKVQVKAWAI
jgi:hypothetical protein